MTTGYYSFIDDVYSTYSSDYVEGYWKTRIGWHFRKIVWNELRNYVKPGGLAFDLGAGSGMDSIFLAKAGMKVVAWDLSKQMVKKMKQQVLKENLQNMIRVEHMGTHDVPGLSRKNLHAFDLIISTFGALNSEPNLPRLIPHFQKLLKNDGVFFGAIYNKFSLFEIISSLLKADFKKLQRRFSKRPYAEIGTSRYPVTVYTPTKFEGMLTPYFRTVLQRGILLGMPSMSMLRIMENIPQHVLDTELTLSNLMENFPFLWVSDQFLNVARPIL